MFICQHCQRRTDRGEKAHMLVVELRAHVHPPRSYYMRGESKPRTDRGGPGTQIVRELRVCTACSHGFRSCDNPAGSVLREPLVVGELERR